MRAAAPPEPSTTPVAPTAPRGGVLVGIAAGNSEPQAAEMATALGVELAQAFPSSSHTVLVLTRRRAGVVALPASALRPPGAAPVPSGGTDGDPALARSDEFSALLAAAEHHDSSALALVHSSATGLDAAGLRAILSPILDEGFDAVCLCPARQRFDGPMTSGIAYPLTRVLFGLPLRQPVAREMALSRRAATLLSSDGAWLDEVAVSGADFWLGSPAFTRELRICQTFLDRERPRTPTPEASQALAHVLGILFRGVEQHADVWQRRPGHRALASFGTPRVLETAPPPAVDGMAEAFRLGHRNLQGLWVRFLSPATLLAVKRAAEATTGPLRFGDAAWARLVYEFAIAFHEHVMDRAQLLLSMTPLYLGWVASFTDELASASGEEVERRVDVLCNAFEAEKRYLVARWRWRDRFAP